MERRGPQFRDQKTTRVPAPIRRRERTPGSRRKRGVYWERPRQKKARARLPRCVVVVFFFCTLRHKLIDGTPSYPGRFVSLFSGASAGGAGGLPGALLGGECLCKGSPCPEQPLWTFILEQTVCFQFDSVAKPHLYSGKTSLLAVAASPREGTSVWEGAEPLQSSGSICS